MKKYLMTGVAALAFAATLTSCSKAGDLYDEGRIEKEKEVSTKKDFASQFEAKFGTPDKNHNWGFDNVAVADLTSLNKATTRSHNVNRNEWANTFVIPANVTADERNLVVTEFSKKRVGVVNTENVNWADYFIYEVYKGEQVYKDGFDQDVKGSDKMNHLQVKKAEGDLLPPDNACWEHANDFNNGDHNSKWGNIEGATLMLNSGTLDFAYLNSTDSKYHSEYIIIPGAKIDESLKDYYYVGFDFYATHPEGQEANKNMDVERDWVFNDWIVRISPASLKNTKMIIAEDLSANNGSDFDYNDVVFTVGFSVEQVATDGYQYHQFAHITLLAAGGTMPLYVGGKANGVEVHEAFGVSTSTMVNTNNGTVSKAPVLFVLDMGSIGWSQTPTANPKDIEVYVEGKTNLTLGTEIGQPSEKLCVDQNFQWCDEREPIETKYARFPDWVKNRSVKWY